MENLNASLYISKLIAKSFQGKLTEEEQIALDTWLKEPGNRPLYDSLRHCDLQTKKEQTERLHPKRSWNQLNQQLPFNRKLRVLSLLKYAAVILIPVLIISVIYYNYPVQQEQPAIVSQAVIPGSSKATLIFSDGQEIALQTNQDLIRQNDTNVKFNNQDNTLKVENLSLHIPQTENYQTLSIPLGGEYKLILSDGTKIWLNSDTRLKFPDVFNSDKRLVYLEGEAYFEVAHLKNQPFIVRTPEMDIQVLGTKFNVKAYAEDQIIYTTLAEGAVQTITPHKSTLVLSPNQQCQYTKATGKMEKQDVDVRIFTGWTEGKFIFENESLEEIMKQLNRWYATEVIYQNPEIRKYRFTGWVNRFDNIKTILDMIEKTYNIRFNVQGNNIVVSE